MIKTIVEKGSPIFVSSLFERVVAAIIYIFIARIYGATIYGEIVTIFSVSVILDSFFQFGYPIFIQRETAKSSKRIDYILKQTISSKIIVYGIYLVSILCYFFYFGDSLPLKLIILISSVVFLNGMSNILNSYFQGRLENYIVLKGIFYSRLILMIFGIIIIFSDLDVYYLFSLWLFSYVYQFLFLFKKSEIQSILKTFDFREIDVKFNLHLIISCFPLLLSTLFYTASDRLDAVMISVIENYEQVGFYTASYSIYKLPLIVFSLFFVSGFSAITKESNNKKLVDLEFRKLIKIVLVISLLIAIVLFFLSDFIITTLFSELYTESVYILKILSFAFIFIGLNNLTGMMINSLSLNSENVLVLLTGLIFNIFLNITLINIYGIIGAAYSTILTELLIFSLQYYLIKSFLISRAE